MTHEMTPNPTWTLSAKGKTDAEYVIDVMISARLLGCTCDLEVEFVRDEFGPEMHYVGVFHEDDCPLLIRKEVERVRMKAPEN